MSVLFKKIYCAKCVRSFVRTASTSVVTGNSTKKPYDNYVIKSEMEPVPVATESFAKTFFDALLFNAINAHSNRRHNEIAFINSKEPDQRVSYSNLYIFSHCVGAFLRQIGFKRGDICCVALPNGWEFVATFGGIIREGGVISPTNYQFTSFELARQFVDSRCSRVFCHESNFQNVIEAVRSAPGVQSIVVVPSKSDSKMDFNGTRDCRAQIFKFAEILEGPQLSSAVAEFADCDVERDLLILPYSSGTSGTPKGVMITSRNFGTMMRLFGGFIKKNFYPFHQPHFEPRMENEVVTLPLYHIYGFSLIAMHMLNGTTCVMMERFEPELYCQIIEKYRIRMLFSVPPIINFLAKSPLVDKYDLSSVELIGSGAAPVGSVLCKEVMNRLPSVGTVVQAFGMTELSLLATMAVPTRYGQKFDSSGRLLSNNEMRIVDLSTGEDVPKRGQVGEIWLRGPTIMAGYWQRADATAETILEDGWMRTGDIGYVDEDGDLYVVDRCKELIKVKGSQVPPAELEEILLSSPKIADCAVIGIPDEKCGEVPRAYVVKADNSLTADEVFNYVKERVTAYKYLVGGVEFVPQIPKSPAGKILRRELRDKYKAEKANE